MNKLTDNEIIKALEESTSEHLAVYMNCATSKGIVSISPADILDLINRQKEEIERLKKENEFHRKTITEIINNTLKEMTKNITKIKHSSLCETETYKGGE